MRRGKLCAAKIVGNMEKKHYRHTNIKGKAKGGKRKSDGEERIGEMESLSPSSIRIRD